MSSIIHIGEVDSTNSFLKELLLKEKLSEGTVVIARNQTAGKGQRGNSWESEEGKNLTFSVVLYPKFIPITEQFILSKIVSLAVKQTLSKYTNNITIKWPNDIYWNEKKICGILIENSLSENKIESCVIGIGININQTAFVSDAPNPTSLKQITGKEFELESILIDIRDSILSYYDEMRQGGAEQITKDYINSLFRKEGYHLYNDGKEDFEAKIKDIQSTGHLVLETKDGDERIFVFKEVKYII